MQRAFPMPIEPAEYIVQEHKVEVGRSFHEPTLARRELRANVRGTERMLRITPEGKGCYAIGYLANDPYLAFQPPRHPVDKAFLLQPGQFGRLTVNGRTTSSHGQAYYETIYNVACGDDLRADCFLREPPDHDVDLKTHLF
jgi:hypothetical protein